MAVRATNITFPKAKIVVAPDWYGKYCCFHIDPGTGETLPIYIDLVNQLSTVRKVNRLMGSQVDVVTFEVPYGEGETSGVRLYLKRLKESNAR